VFFKGLLRVVRNVEPDEEKKAIVLIFLDVVQSTISDEIGKVFALFKNLFRSLVEIVVAFAVKKMMIVLTPSGPFIFPCVQELIPLRCGCRPVNNAAREGQQTVWA
jgi:hypothetical protein